MITALIHIGNDEDQFDKQRFAQVLKSSNLALALWDMDQWLRTQIKHNDKAEYQAVRNELYEILDSHGLDFDKLVS